MRYLGLSEVLEIHRRISAQSGGANGIRDLEAVLSALAQPQMTFGGEELYLLGWVTLHMIRRV
jgi:death on curing protein